MKLIYMGKEIGNIVTNHSMTVEEACACLGYDPYSAEECEQAYKDGFEAAYSDDEGGYAIDCENIEMIY